MLKDNIEEEQEAKAEFLQQLKDECQEKRHLSTQLTNMSTKLAAHRNTAHLNE
jgi:hypothetical protein